MKKGFTLMEILIVVALIVALATALLITLNPLAQINKGQDSKRKHELTQLNKVFEDFYNDKQCYPKPDEVCYKDKTSTVCPICGNDAGSPDFNPYLPQLPCDPRHSQKKYLYQIDDTTCPTYYRIYTTLSNTADPVIVSVGCQFGCGPAPDFSYNYGVSSPNIGLESNNNLCSLTSPLYFNPFCNICGTYSECKINHPGEIYYTDPGICTITCIKD